MDQQEGGTVRYKQWRRATGASRAASYEGEAGEGGWGRGGAERATGKFAFLGLDFALMICDYPKKKVLVA